MRMLLWAVVACHPVVDSSPELVVDAAPPPIVLVRETAAVPDEELVLAVEGVPPGSRVTFVRGGAVRPRASCPAAVAPLCLDVTRPAVVGSVGADPRGRAELRVVVPPAAPVGARAAFQAVGGGGKSSAIEVRVVEPLGLLGAWEDAWGGVQELDPARWRDGYGDV